MDDAHKRDWRLRKARSPPTDAELHDAARSVEANRLSVEQTEAQIGHLKAQCRTVEQESEASRRQICDQIHQGLVGVHALERARAGLMLPSGSYLLPPMIELDLQGYAASTLSRCRASQLEEQSQR